MKFLKLTLVFFLITLQGFAHFATTNPNKSVDILILVDNSASMAAYQKAFSEKVEKALAPFAYSSLNIGLITTDAAINPVFVGSKINGTFSEVMAQLKKEIRSVGTNGSASEAHMSQILKTFKQNSRFNFHRSNTELQVFIVTDEDEQDMTAKEFVTEAVKFKTFDKLFVNVYSPKCRPAGNFEWRDSQLYFLSSITGGTQNDLCP
jgi:hypothetical protein